MDTIVTVLGCPASAKMPCTGMKQASFSNDLKFRIKVSFYRVIFRTCVVDQPRKKDARWNNVNKHDYEGEKFWKIWGPEKSAEASGMQSQDPFSCS